MKLILLLTLVSTLPAAQPVIADYASIIKESAPRADQQVHLDTPAMISTLRDLHVNTYIYLVHGTLDWNDMKDEFLPAAEKAGLDVWLYFLPPSECPIATCTLPWGHDYIRLHEESAKLSLLHKNLKGTAIDDFSDNVKLYTPEYVARMRAAGHAVNPAFQFYPLLYTKSMKPAFLDAYKDAIDGVIWAYRDEPTINTSRYASLRAQLTESEELLTSRGKQLILMIYCTPLGRLPIPPSAEYVRETVKMGLEDAKAGKLTGVVTYKLEKYKTAPAKENYAFEGNGRATLVASGPSYKIGDYAELRRTINYTGKCSISFAHTVNYGKLPPGYFFQQVLVNDQVIWEQDVSSAISANWSKATADLPPVNGPAILSFRLALKKNAGSNQIVAGFDALTATGFSLEDPGFETGSGWIAESKVPMLMPLVQIFDMQRPALLYDAVKQLYTEARK